MTVLDVGRGDVTHAEQQSTLERSAGVADSHPLAVRPLFPLENSTHHMRDFVAISDRDWRSLLKPRC